MFEIVSQHVWVGTLLLPFLLATMLSTFYRGPNAFHWSSGKVQSGIANLSLMLFNGLFLSGAVWMAVSIAGQLSSHIMSGSGAREWMADHPAAAFIVFFLAKDFVDYWLHRLMHAPGWWRLHVVHHTESEMNFTTGFRVHPLEVAAIALISAMLALVLGTPAEIAALAGLVATLHNFYAHMSVPVSHGPFDRLVASPRVHQWHHADTPEAHGKNLANIFPVWDVLFRTYYNPGPCNHAPGCSDYRGQHPGKLLSLPAAAATAS